MTRQSIRPASLPIAFYKKKAEYIHHLDLVASFIFRNLPKRRHTPSHHPHLSLLKLNTTTDVIIE